MKTVKKQGVKLPDKTISAKEMKDYGYFWNGMFPLREEMARQLFLEGNLQIFRLYTDGSEALCESLKHLEQHTKNNGLFGVEKEDWQNYENHE